MTGRRLTHAICQTILAPLMAACALIMVCSCGRSGERTVYHEQRELYDSAAACQSVGNLSRARELYTRCMQYSANDQNTNDSLLPTTANALVQILNIYQSEGQLDSCVTWLARLSAQAPNSVMGRLCRRDIATCYAYAMSRTEDTRQAATLMDKALRIKMANPTPERLFRDYAYASAVYYCVPGRINDAIKCCHKALNELRHCSNRSGAIWISSMLGMLYKRTGEIRKAVNTYAYCYKLASETNDSLAMANACYLTSDILQYWHLASYANEYADKALYMIERSNRQNPMIHANILNNKAVVMYEMGRTDSALLYADRACDVTKDMPYNCGRSDADLIRARVLIKSEASRNEGERLLRKVANNATEGIKARAQFSLAKALISHGNLTEGDAALDSAFANVGKYSSPVLSNEVCEYAFKHYSDEGDNAKILFISKQYINLMGKTSNSEVLQKVAQNMAEFKTEKQQEELSIDQMKLASRKRMVIWYGVAVSLMVIIVVTTAIAKIRYERLQRKSAQQALENLTLRLEQARSESVAQQTGQPSLGGGKPESTESATTDDAANNDNQYIELSTTKINDSECEQNFRRTFMQIHPKFLVNLRTKVPQITRREELLAMLIALKLDNSQIENIMCIAHSSVNMARYRLRSKMKLSRDMSLEEAIYQFVD